MRRNYALLSAFLFLFFAQAGAMSFLAIWLKGPIRLTGARAGTVFSANFIAAVGSVIGIGGTVGATGGMVMAKYAGYALETFGSYVPLFAVAGSAYVVALLVIHLLSPRLAKVGAIRE